MIKIGKTRIASAAEFTASTIIFEENDFCIESDTGRTKRGDGESQYSALAYLGIGGIGDEIDLALQGSVLFVGAGGILSQNNAAFKWTDADTQLALTAGAATKTPLLVKAFAAQSANLFEIQPSNSTTPIFKVTANGSVAIATAAYGADLRMNDAGGQQFNVNPDNGYVQVNNSLTLRWVNGGSLVSDVGITRVRAGVLRINDGTGGGGSAGGGGAVQFSEQTAPAAPAANDVVIFAQDNGGGKTQLMALFSSGVAQQIAIQP